jgi:hypothetical protein
VQSNILASNRREIKHNAQTDILNDQSTINQAPKKIDGHVLQEGENLLSLRGH